MNVRKKWVLVCLVLLIASVCFAGCRGRDAYRENDKMGYNVSVKFDACGGSFVSGNTPTIVDSFNISNMQKNGNGQVEIPLSAPQSRKNVTMQNGSQILVGWYQERTENPDGSYSYAKPWNFETDRVTVDPNGDYTSREPVKTLYAAWAEQPTIQFYNIEDPDGEPMQTTKVSFDVELKIPAWNEDSGAMNMGDFPGRDGYTYMAAYYDPEGKQPVEGAMLKHTGEMDLETGKVKDPTMKIYLSWKQGTWYRISTAKQLANNFSPIASYELMADLDFAEATWPTGFMHGDYQGVLQGNGYTIRNVSIVQKDAKRMNTGLFGVLTETAAIRDVTFENITLTIEKGCTNSGTAFGLLAGTVKSGAGIQDVQFVNCTVEVAESAIFTTADYVIGKICGIGTVELDDSAITVINPQAEEALDQGAGEETPDEESVVDTETEASSDVPDENI